MKLSAAVFLLSTSVSLLVSAPAHWVATWAASAAPQLPEDQMRAAHLEFSNQTLREVIHTSIGGAKVRLRLSNAFGKQNVRNRRCARGCSL
jgi:hypothetical protein